MDPSTIMIASVVGLIFLVMTTIFVFLRLYKVAPKDKAFVRTGVAGGGKVIVDNNEYVGAKGDGKYFKRGLSQYLI